MEDSVSLLGYRQGGLAAAPSMVSGFTSATSAVAIHPRTFCVVCGNFSSELTLRRSGLKCPKCIGKKANKHWAKLQKQQATQLLSQVATEEQQMLHQQLQGVSSALTDSGSYCGGAGGGGGALGSFDCSASQEDEHVEGGFSAVARSNTDSLSHGGHSGQPTKPRRAGEGGQTSGPSTAAAAAVAASHPINDYISKTIVFKAAVHEATMSSTHVHGVATPTSSATTTNSHEDVLPRPYSPATSKELGKAGPSSTPPPPPAATAAATTAAATAVKHTDPNRRGDIRETPPPPRLPPRRHTSGAGGAGLDGGLKDGRDRTPPPLPVRPPSRRVPSSAASSTPKEGPTASPTVAEWAEDGVCRGKPTRLRRSGSAPSVERPPTALPCSPEMDGGAVAHEAVPATSRSTTGRAPKSIYLREPSVVISSGASGADGGEGEAYDVGDAVGLVPPLLNSRRGSEISVVSLAQRARRAGSCVQPTGAESGEATPRSAAMPLKSRDSSVRSAFLSNSSQAAVHNRRGSRLPERRHRGESALGAAAVGADCVAAARASGTDGPASEGADGDDDDDDSSFPSGDGNSDDEPAAREPTAESGASAVGSPCPLTGSSRAASAAAAKVNNAKGSSARSGATRRPLPEGQLDGSATAAAVGPKPSSSLLPLCLDSIAVRVTVPPPPRPPPSSVREGSATAGCHHSRTASTTSNTSSSSNKPFGYRVKSQTTAGAGASTTANGSGAAGAGNEGAGGKRFTVTRLAPVSTAAAKKPQCHDSGHGHGPRHHPHRRGESSISACSFSGTSGSTSSSAAAATVGSARRPTEEARASCHNGWASGSVSNGNDNEAGGAGQPCGEEGVEVVKLRYLLHVKDAVTGTEVFKVERSYFNDILPALEAVKKLAKGNRRGAAGPGGDGAAAGPELPPLPSRRIPSLRMATTAFIEERRAALEAFFAAVCGNPFFVRHPSIVSLLRLFRYLPESSGAPATAPAAPLVVGARQETPVGEGQRRRAEGDETGGAAPLTNDALRQFRDGGAAVERDAYRAASLSGSEKSTRSSVVRRSRLDCVTLEDLEAVQLGNLLGRGSFGAVFLGLIQSSKGPLMIAVKELQVKGDAAALEHGSLTGDADSSSCCFTPQEGDAASTSGGKGRRPVVATASRTQGQGALVQADELRRLQGELEILRRAHHKNVVRFLGSIFVRRTNTLRVFTEYVECGTVRSLVQKFGAMPLRTIQSYMTQMLAGLHHLHRLGILHRDIKGENILVTKNGRVKLSDFGCSSVVGVLAGNDDEESLNSNDPRLTQNSSTCPTLPVGTPLWMAPEVINGTGYDGVDSGDEDRPTASRGDGGSDTGTRGTVETNPAYFASDVWALGCVGIEMLDRPLWCYETSRLSPFVILYKIGTAGTPPHGLPTESELAEIQRTPGREEEWEAFSLYRDFLSQCLIPHPRRRWTVAQLQQHPFLRMPLSRSLRWLPPPPKAPVP